MELYKVYFISEEMAIRLKPEPYWACISITEPGREAKLQEGWSNLLRLQFHDIGGRYGNADDKTLIPMSEKQAEQAVDFLDEITDDNKTRYLIVHCYAGISRSAATALFAHENYTPVRYKMMGTDKHNHFVRNKLELAYHRKHDIEEEKESIFDTLDPETGFDKE